MRTIRNPSHPDPSVLLALLDAGESQNGISSGAPAPQISDAGERLPTNLNLQCARERGLKQQGETVEIDRRDR
jgi:hypothetical protein